MMTIPGYALIDPICEAGDLVLYKATREKDGLPVLLKVPAPPRPAPTLLRRLEHEYELVRDLDSLRIARPIALERRAGRVVLILEQGPTRSLASLVGSPMEIQSFLRIANGITAALADLHRNGLIHKDIKPEHVLLDATGQVWLTGLGIASRLTRERQTPDPPEVIEGTLPYMAPEQTGRMNRSVDSRSDLYALGITFYQMLCGVLPFDADDPMEWVHCHIARQPVPLIRRVAGLPEPLSEIVMKLLAKTSEDRYQSVNSLDADLRRCLEEWESNGHIAHFPLGAHDLPDRLLIPEKLYGRESEIKSLLAAFDQVLVTGMPEIVLISGYSGIGKTSVVRELHKALVPPRGLFASGKFDQYKRDIPYATLVQPLQTLVRHILGKGETEIAAWRDAIRNAVTPNGQLIVSLIPEVEHIIGEQPTVPDLSPQEARNRFQMVLQSFLACFAGHEHPLVLFLDDLQWLDRATLDLIERIGTEQDLRHLLLICAYRDNEVGPTHPLMHLLETIRKAGIGLREIELAPLAIDDLCCLIADSLHCERSHALPLARLVHEKTGGNPFFARQFLTVLSEEGLLKFDTSAPGWRWDMARIRARNYTDNVVDLMTEKLKRLPAATRKALEQLACLGNVVDLDTLAAAFGETEAAIRAALWQAVLAGLVFQQDTTCKFLHDRIQQAAYSLIPEGRRAEVHLHIGQHLLSHTPEERLAESIFEIVGHLNRGSALITVQEEHERLAELNLIAGKRAKAATAYVSALTYFITGSNLLAGDIWERRYELAFNLVFNRAVCEFLTGHMEEAEDRLSHLSSRTHNLIDASAVACQRIEVNTTLNQFRRAVEIGLEYLRSIDAKWTLHPSDDEVRQEYQRLLQQFGDRRVEDLIDLPSAEPDQCAVMDVLTTLDTAALFLDKNLLALIVARIANLSLEHGNSDGSCLGYVWFHHFLTSLFDEYELGYRFGKLACDLVEKRGLVRYEPRVYQAFSWVVSPWTHHINECREMIRNSFATAQEIGQVPSTFAAQFIDVSIGLYSGDSLSDLQPDVETGLELSRKTGFDMYIIHFTGILRFIQSLRGITDEEFEEEQFEIFIESDPQQANGAFWYWVRKLQSLSYAGNYTAAMAAAAKVEQFFQFQFGIIEVAEYHLHGALVRAVLYDTVAVEEQTQYLETIKNHHQQLATGARHCPANFEDRAALVGAEIDRIEGRDLEAMRGYEQAIHSARENGFVQQIALAAEVAARFYEARGFETITHAYLRDAHAAYARWGAQGKVRQLEQIHPWLVHSGQPQTVILAEHLDALSLAKAQRAISSEIGLDNLVQTLLRIVMESAGAQTGFLSVEGASRLRAEMQPGSDDSQQIVFDASPRDEDIPGAVINYVRHSRNTVNLDNAGAHTGEFSEDNYLRRIKPKSVLCMVIQRQDKLLGVLYLENNLITGAFTPERRAVLEVLAAQAAISLETTAVYEALQESEERLRSVLNAAEIVAWEANPEKGRLFEAGPVGKLFGRDEDFSHPNVVDFAKSIHPDDRHRVMDSIDRSLHGEGGYNEEFRVPMADGSIRWIAANGSLQTYTEGKPGRLLGIARDITNQKLAEEAHRNTERHLRTIMENFPDFIARFDEQGRHLYINPAVEKGLGVKLEQYVGKTLHDLNTPGPSGQNDMLLAAIQQAFNEGSQVLVEAVWPTPIGDRIFEVRHIPEINDQGKVVSVIGVTRDITDRRRAEEELRAHRDHLEELVKQRSVELTDAKDVAEEARRSAEAANKAKSIFLANISHELRTPLNAILGYSQLMQRDTSLLPEQQDYLNTINRSGEHLLALINDVLEISKIEAGQITLDIAPFDLRALLGDMEEMFRVRTDSKGLRLDFIGVDAVPRYLETDENKLRQILINVLGNAVKFTQRGSVTLRVDIKRMGYGPESKETIDSGAQCLCFEVEDSGVGIAEQELDRVFAAFEQTESGRISRTGTGLGMAITQSYVHLMGGEISVVSTPGKGSIFRIEIAVSEVNQTDIKEQARVQRRVIGLQPDQEIPRILVVEDMDESRAMLVKLLGIVGFQVREALNGKQAVEIFRQWQPNFIWMDILMPEMDGLEATRHIKQSEAGESTIIAALTAHALEEEREEILAAGCDDVVRKPLREHDIFDVMKKHLELKYLYEDAGEETAPAKSKDEIGPEQLTALPVDLLSQLYQAALELNEQQSLTLIEKIKPIDANIAHKLEVLVRNFAYDTLQDLVKRSEQSSPGDTHN